MNRLKLEKYKKTVAEELNSPKDRIRVIVTEVPKTHWGIAGVPVSDIPGR